MSTWSPGLDLGCSGTGGADANFLMHPVDAAEGCDPSATPPALFRATLTGGGDPTAGRLTPGEWGAAHTRNTLTASHRRRKDASSSPDKGALAGLRADEVDLVHPHVVVLGSVR